MSGQTGSGTFHRCGDIRAGREDERLDPEDGDPAGDRLFQVRYQYRQRNIVGRNAAIRDSFFVHDKDRPGFMRSEGGVEDQDKLGMERSDLSCVVLGGFKAEKYF